MDLVSEGGFLVAYIPASARALVFWVYSIRNRGYEKIHYGPLPLPQNAILPRYDGGTTTVPAPGVLPANSFTPPMSFPMRGVYDETDMWFIAKEWRDTVFHVITNITPRWVRISVDIPMGIMQGRFQKDKIITGVPMPFGYSRGSIEMIHLPGIRYGYRFGNDTNLDIRTAVSFTYGEYIIRIPSNPELVANILSRRISARWVTLPINVYDTAIRTSLIDTYGTEGFQIMMDRARAVETYRQEIANVKQEILGEVG